MEQYTDPVPFRHLNRRPEPPPGMPQPKPESAWRDLQKVEGAIQQPVSTALQYLIQHSENTARYIQSVLGALEKQNKARDELLKNRGYAQERVTFAAGGDPLKVDLGGGGRGVRTQGVRFFSFTTVPGGPQSGDPDGAVVYFKFGPDLIRDGANPPENYDGLLSVGGKLQKLHTPHGVESLSFWSKSPFKAMLYLTAGEVTELPEL